MTQLATQRRSEQGFTLVELAIVMVIIGLLIAGILKGQELIANARISATVTQLKSLDAALNTFQDKYNAKPGDMSDATTRLPGCAAPCIDGNGDGRIAANLALPTATGATAEGAMTFVHMARADLISGIDTTGANIILFGKALPSVSAGGGLWLGYAAAASPLGTVALGVGRQYAVLNGSAAAPTLTTGGVVPGAAAQIDRKIDDGLPNVGSVQAAGTGCTAATTPVSYNEVGGANPCVMYARVLN